MNILPDHQEGRGEASKKVREHLPSAQEARPARQVFGITATGNSLSVGCDAARLPEDRMPPSTQSSEHSSLHRAHRRYGIVRTAAFVFAGLLLLLIVAGAAVRLWMGRAMHESLPQTAGSLHIAGLSAPVKVDRDSHGIPHIVAANVDDLVLAQGFVTAQDRLWQMDMLRRHVTGRLAEVLGSSQLEHDRTQRYLQMRESAQRALAGLSPEEQRYLQRYADGVNDAIAADGDHLPAEFRALNYTPEKWTALDSLLVVYAMIQDLTTEYPYKLSREAVEAILNRETDGGHMPGELAGDLYPVGSFRDHPPQAGTGLANKPTQGNLPAHFDDDSQAQLAAPQRLNDLLQQNEVLAASVGSLRCEGCTSGSNNWAVSGAHTATGKPLVSNDPHLGLTVPGIWYTANLEAGNFHVTGAAIPGIPFIVVGHNAHVAWGFTNSYADVQDLYVERIEGDQYRSADGALHPIIHQQQQIVVKRGSTEHIDIQLTEHGGVQTPILSPLYPNERRAVALRWSIYDPAAMGFPLFQINSAASGVELLEAMKSYGSPAQNLVWGDDAGHIGYHLVGRVPLRGPNGESGLSPVPVNTGTYEWTGYIPFDDLPQVTDPTGGVVATANARVSPDNPVYPVALDWAAPYRNERIWTVLQAAPNGATGLKLDDMQKLQNDTYSALDKMVAEHVVYGVDHARAPSKRDRMAADILRKWDGHVAADAVAPNLTEAVRLALMQMLLEPHLHDNWKLYQWGESAYAEELLIQNQPPRWLPAEFTDWNELLTAALDRGMKDSHAPADLHGWTWGSSHRLELSHPVFGSMAALRLLTGTPTTGAQPMSGNQFTVRAFKGHQSASMRFTADLADPTHATLSLPMGESGNPASAWFMDQWAGWYRGLQQALPYSSGISGTQTLMLEP